MTTLQLWRALISIITLNAISFAVNGQSVWNKTYVEDREIMLFSSVVKDSNQYHILGITSGSPTGYSRTVICNLNEDAMFANYKVIGDSTQASYGTFTNSLISTKRGGIAFSGYSYDTLAYLLFGISDKNLDSLSISRYYTPNTFAYHGYSMLQYSDGNYYITGVRTPNPGYNSNLALLKIDSIGNRLWEKMYDQYKIDYAKRIIKLSNGNLMLGAVRNDLGQPVEHANTWLLEVDTGGNIVRQWFDPNDSTYAAEGLLQTQDGGFIYGAQKKFEQTVNSVYRTATVVKMDSAFNKQWIFSGGTEGDFTGVNDIVILSDGTYVACGRYNNRLGWVVKLNAAGSVIWERKYTGFPDTGTYNILTDIDVLQDGNLIAFGECQYWGSTHPQVGWFLKLDSNGCEIENCLVDVQDIDAVKKPIVYPNPFTSDLNISVEGAGDFEITIYSLLGQVVYSEGKQRVNGIEKLVLGNLPGGVYFLRIEVDGKLFTERIIKE